MPYINWRGEISFFLRNLVSAKLQNNNEMNEYFFKHKDTDYNETKTLKLEKSFQRV